MRTTPLLLVSILSWCRAAYASAVKDKNLEGTTCEAGACQASGQSLLQRTSFDQQQLSLQTPSPTEDPNCNHFCYQIQDIHAKCLVADCAPCADCVSLTPAPTAVPTPAPTPPICRTQADGEYGYFQDGNFFNCTDYSQPYGDYCPKDGGNWSDLRNKSTALTRPWSDRTASTCYACPANGSWANVTNVTRDILMEGCGANSSLFQGFNATDFASWSDGITTITANQTLARENVEFINVHVMTVSELHNEVATNGTNSSIFEFLFDLCDRNGTFMTYINEHAFACLGLVNKYSNDCGLPGAEVNQTQIIDTIRDLCEILPALLQSLGSSSLDIAPGATDMALELQRQYPNATTDLTEAGRRVEQSQAGQAVEHGVGGLFATPAPAA